MSKFKIFISSILLMLFLTSCIWGGWNSWKNNWNVKEIIWNNSLSEELWDREEAFKKIAEKQVSETKNNKTLNKNIEKLFKYILDTNWLLIADIKIIESIQNWQLEEKYINKDNYLYKYIKTNPNEAKKILENLENFNVYLANPKTIVEDYLIVLRGEKEFYNFDNLLLYKLWNYYLNNWKYKKDILKLLKKIDTDFSKWKEEEYQFKSVKLWNSKKTEITIKKTDIKSLIEEISNKDLNKK